MQSNYPTLFIEINNSEYIFAVGDENEKKNFKVYAEYFDQKLVRNFLKKKLKFDLIFSANTITHINTISNVFKNINKILTDDGVFILEEPSFLECFKKNAFDQFYNEHIYVLSAISLTASGVMSLPVRPVPPVVMITSISSLRIHSFKIFFISSLSSLHIFLSNRMCEASSIFLTKIAPDLSFSKVLVSVTVKIAILTFIIFVTIVRHEHIINLIFNHRYSLL